MAARETTKTYILELKGGNIRKITIPEKWKLTYGNVVPYQGKGSHNGEHRVALRLYDGTNLRSVMTDVVSFRDTSFTIMERRTETKKQTLKRESPQGSKDVVVEARVTEWVNPDNEADQETPPEFLRITGTVEAKEDAF